MPTCKKNQQSLALRLFSILLASLTLALNGCGSFWPDERGDFIAKASETVEEDIQGENDDEEFIIPPHAWQGNAEISDNANPQKKKMNSRIKKSTRP